MTNELERLEALARAATPGAREWACLQDDCANELWAGTRWCSIAEPCSGDGEDYLDTIKISRADALFIAACDPTTILSLIQRVREAEARADKSDMQAFGAISLLPGDMLLSSVREAVRNMEMTMLERYSDGKAAGRADTLEEAARVAQRYEELWKLEPGFGDRAVAAKIITDTIRALEEKV